MSESTHTNGTDGGHVNTTWKLGLSTLERFGVVIAFIALFAYNAITQPETFLKPENLRNLLNQNADIGVIAVGMTLVIIAGGIDLSVGAVMAFAAAVGMITMNSLFEGSMNETLAVIIGLATGIGLGAACGLLNGLLVTIGRIPAFIVTLAGLIGFRSVTLAIAEGGEIRAADKLNALQTFGRDGFKIPGVLDYYDQPVVFYWNILIFFAVVIAGQLLLSRTRLGRHFIAVGSNEIAAKYSGIAVNRVRTWSYVLVGACAGIAALMSLARMNSVSSSGVGHLAELDAIAAVVIGGTAMTGGRGRVWGTMLGVLILIMISNMLTLADVEVYWQGFVKGVIIILAVLIQRGKAN
ncbi:ABC transporter permease [Phycisphaerales bacterium]|nr:ABC transporter permease [Phycisphaerales bacterium]RPG15083.1 MAG: ABC transporter permease [Phycisphaera sp. TMED9]